MSKLYIKIGSKTRPDPDAVTPMPRIKQAAIIQTAIDCGASVLYTERLPNAQRYGGVRIVNPFAPRSWSTRQTLATYTVHAATT